VQSSKIFTAHLYQRDTNFKHEKVGIVKAGFLNFSNLNLLPLQKKEKKKKTLPYRFP